MTTPTQRGGRTIARRYRLDEVIGRGAMGAVWRAEDTTLRRAVAVKEVVLPHGLSKDDRAVACERTLREARAIARLAHPNVVTLYDVLDEDERPWVVMELVLAKSLAALLKESGPVDHLRAARIGLAVLSALQAAHEVGIIHRDVKPGNILIGDDGLVKLTDFGIARAAGDMTLTGTGLLVGSPSYMAPEVIRGEDTGPAADLFGLGATLYCAVEGHPPFGGGDAMATLSAVVSDPPKPYRSAGPLVPALDGLLEKDPRRRLTAAQARHRLLEVLREHEIGSVTSRVSPHALVADRRTDPPLHRDAGHPGHAGHAGPAGHPGHAGPGHVGRRADPVAPGAGSNPASPLSAAAMPRAGAPPYQGYPGPQGHGHPGYQNVQDVADFQRQPDWATPRRPASSAQRRGRVTVVAAAVLAVAVVIGSIAISRSLFGGGDDRDSAATDGGQDGGTGGQPPDAGPGEVPDGYVTYTSTAHGFSAAVPENWKGSAVGAATQFQRKGDQPYLRLYAYDSTAGGPTSRFSENAFRQSHQGYQRIKLDSVRYRDYDAAEWEFTYPSDGVTRHVLWRSFVVGDKLFGIYLSAPEEQFQDSMAYFETATSTFSTG